MVYLHGLLNWPYIISLGLILGKAPASSYQGGSVNLVTPRRVTGNGGSARRNGSENLDNADETIIITTLKNERNPKRLHAAGSVSSLFCSIRKRTPDDYCKIEAASTYSHRRTFNLGIIHNSIVCILRVGNMELQGAFIVHVNNVSITIQIYPDEHKLI